MAQDMSTAFDEVNAAAYAYCAALNAADGDALDALCHERFLMTWVKDDGTPRFLNKEKFVGGIRSLEADKDALSCEVISVDVEGTDIAHVKLWVDMPPRRYMDYLGFFRVEGEWRLITKLFRVAKGPEL
jgi:Putative lumazine-binding